MWVPGRTRSKRVHQLDLRNKDMYYWENSNNTWHLYSPSSLQTTVKLQDEVMEDDYPTSKGSAHNCRHTVSTIERLSPLHSWMYSWSPYGYQGCWDAGSVLSAVPTQWQPVLPSPSQDLYFEALMSIDPLAPVWEGLPFIGELSSTISMIRRPLSFWKAISVPKRYRHLPCGRILKRGLFTANVSSGSWLSYQYGWKPLFSDMDKVSTALGSMRDSYNEYLRGNPTYRSLRFPGATAASRDVDDSTAWFNGIRKVYECETKTLLTLLYKITPAQGTSNALSYASYASERLGLDAGNILKAGWELVPYSFVVDWFLPVGDYLSKVRGLSCNFEVKDVCTHTTQRSSVVYEHRSDFWDVHRPGVFNIDRGFVPTSRAETEIYTRYVGHPRGEPTSNGLTSTRAITALSLIAQRLLLPITHK